MGATVVLRLKVIYVLFILVLREQLLQISVISALLLFVSLVGQCVEII